MNILALDPGPTESAAVLYEPGKPGRVIWAKTQANELWRRHFGGVMLGHFTTASHPVLVIEDMQSFGMPVGKEVFETVRWTGRFDSAWPSRHEYIARKDVMLQLCHSSRGNDATLRRALIDRWGGDAAIKPAQKCKLCGGKGWRGRKREPCMNNPKKHGHIVYGSCPGGTPAGPLHGIKGDEWQALGLAVAWSELHGR